MAYISVAGWSEELCSSPLPLLLAEFLLENE